MKIDTTDFQDMCRICLERSQVSFDIYTCYYAKRNTLYSEMLSDCTKIKPDEEDGLPRLICKNCCRQLKRTYIFNLQCVESEKKLRNLLDNNHTIPAETATCLGIKEKVHDLCNNVKDEIEDLKDKSIELLLKEEKAVDEDIKSEPGYNENDENDNWNDDDDNVLIQFKTAQESEVSEANGEVITKKKRGRKKKDGTAVAHSRLPHQCDVCGKILSSKSNLNSHKICHTDFRPYKCTECPASFKGHSGLFQHKRLHTGETPFHCEYCPKQFRRKTALVNHIRMHTGEKLFSCDICFKSFVQSAQLAIHMKRHSGDKSYLCQDCGKGFPIKADLKVHQRVHNGEKPYACHLCEKTFATSGNLSIHVRIHNREVRYNCKYCHRGFITRSSFNVHIKRHSGQRDYSCECGKKFYTSSALKQHKVVHTGEKRYQCKICDRKFTQTSHLSRHFRRDHAKPNAPIPTSDYYKIILPQSSQGMVFEIQKAAPNVDDNLKCEDT
ncbi:zinc finger protein 239-like [Zerene cesonia]|uniref:zinc finger protein 239-like n=1 Tax=Zerene cesonia TaxID=33412 RepID=UPI0018E50BA1|nr:zinc finger protein 239-like [Zerene cesonia]